MKTTTNVLSYAALVVVLFGLLAAFRCLCLFSGECRRIRTELLAEGEVIDPAKRIVARLEVLHAELFGGDE